MAPGCEVPVCTGPLEAPCPRLEHPHPMLRIDLSPIQGEVNTCLRRNVGVSCRRDVSIIGLFCVSRRGAARIRSGVSRSGDPPPIPRPDLVRWLVRTALQAGDARFPSARERRRKWPGATKLLFSVAFGCISVPRTLILAFPQREKGPAGGRDARFLSARGLWRPPADALSTLTRCFASTSPLCRER